MNTKWMILEIGGHVNVIEYDNSEIMKRLFTHLLSDNFDIPVCGKILNAPSKLSAVKKYLRNQYRRKLTMFIADQVAMSDFNISETARVLNTSRRNLYNHVESSTTLMKSITANISGGLFRPLNTVVMGLNSLEEKMTVKELIDQLSVISNKNKPVVFLHQSRCTDWAYIEIKDIADNDDVVIAGDDLPAEIFERDYKYER